MNPLTRIVARILRWSRSPFTPLENHLLAAVGGALSPKARRLYQSQLDAVNKVQRLGRGREINLYRMRGSKPSNDPAMAFRDRRDELAFARVRFRIPSESNARRMTVYMVRGFVFSLVFDPPAAQVQQRDDAEIVKVEIGAEPMRSEAPMDVEPMSDYSQVSDELRRWRMRYGLSGLRRPLTVTERESRIQEIPARLPRDYLRLMAEADGLEVGSWTIYGLAQVHGIALDDAEYQVLAELHDRGILAIENDTENLYFLPFDGSVRAPIPAFTREIEVRLAPSHCRS